MNKCRSSLSYTDWPNLGNMGSTAATAPSEDVYVVDFVKKPKFHLLTHINYWVDRFGPPRNSHTETEEHFNSVIRDKLHYSNRQVPSGDTAEKFATLEGVTFMARSGIWRKKGEDLMTAAGSSFLKVFETEDIWREMVGLEKAIADRDSTTSTYSSHRPGQRLRSGVTLSQITDPGDHSQLACWGIRQVDI